MQRKTDRHIVDFFQSLLELKAEERSVEIEVEWPDSTIIVVM